MHDDEPTYLRTMTWAELLWQLNIDEALRLKLGVKPCPFSGKVEEYMLVDRLGGDLDIWPAKWRGVIEAGRIGVAAGMTFVFSLTMSGKLAPFPSRMPKGS